MRGILLGATTVLVALAAALPAAGSGDLLQWRDAGGIEPCTVPGDAHLLDGLHVSGLLASKGIVRASENDRFRLELRGDVYGVAPLDDSFPPDPQLVSRLTPAAFALEPAREQSLRAGNTVELAPIDWVQLPDDGRVWKQLLDDGQSLRFDVTATLVLIDGSGARHVLDEVAAQTTIGPERG